MTKPVPRSVKKEWEKQFPALGSDWTHWRLEGDGLFLALVSGDTLGAVLDVVEENWQRFSYIYAYRARPNDTEEGAFQKGYRYGIHSIDKHKELRKFLHQTGGLDDDDV